MNTTLNNIRKHNPCEKSWRELLASLGKTQADDEALPLRYILDTLGIEDAIWALCSIEGADREVRLFACDCAERVLPIHEAEYPEDMRPRNTIEVARRYANGDANEKDLAVARAASSWAGWVASFAAGSAGATSWSVTWSAARTAARAARAAVWAVGSERDAQKELFIKYFCQ